MFVPHTANVEVLNLEPHQQALRTSAMFLAPVFFKLYFIQGQNKQLFPAFCPIILLQAIDI